MIFFQTSIYGIKEEIIALGNGSVPAAARKLLRAVLAEEVKSERKRGPKGYTTWIPLYMAKESDGKGQNQRLASAKVQSKDGESVVIIQVFVDWFAKVFEISVGKFFHLR